MPAVGAEDNCCHFVRQSDLGQAQVLLHDPGNSATLRCVRCPSSGGEAAYPSGWRLRADLAARSSILHLRDGDVLVPGAGPTRRRVQFRALPSLAAALFKRQGLWFIVLSALASALGEGAAGMQAPPRVSHYAGKCRVGKFDWRIPPHLRLCNFAAQSGATARSISPFGGTSEDVPIDPDTSYDQLTDVFLHNEPPWADHLVPIWPALAAHVLDFTFEPSHPSLATLIIVSPDWQAAFLTPSRTDLTWLLQYLRSTSRYPVFRLRPPPNVRAPGVSPKEAIDWRTGDVVFVQPSEGFPQSLTPPVFTNGTHVRHRAFWGLDFHVQQPLTIVIWRPGQPYTKTTMPPGAHWLADRHTFHGEFEQRYPGTWAPVPWAYDDRPHICQRPSDPDCLHIIHERVEDNILRGDCLEISRWSTISSVAGQLNLDPSSLRLLGIDGSTAGRPLRDGDIIHSVDPTAEVSSSISLFSAPGLCLFLLASGHGFQTNTRGFLGPGLAWALCHLATAAPSRDDPPEDTGLQWVWSPYRGKLGPYSLLSLANTNPLRAAEPWWSHGLAYVSPAPHLREAHWVPRSPSPLFANILAFGSPAPTALLLPSRLPKHLLFSVLAQYFPGLEYLSGRIPALAEHFPPETEVSLRDGDAIVTRGSQWSPTLHQQPVSFSDHAAARVQGCWSHPLSFQSNCWILVWRPDGSPPAAVYAEGTQHWDPAACTLRPALSWLPEGWWPSLHGGASAAEPLHFVEASGNIGCANVLHWPRRSCHRLVSADITSWRDGDVSYEGTRTHPDPHHPINTRDSPSTNRAARATGSGFLPACALAVWTTWLAQGWTAPGGPHWGLCLLACYLSAYGAPAALRPDSVIWERDMTAPANLTARLHEYWWHQPLAHSLPEGSPAYAHAAWNRFPLWQGGVPSSLLIATDGSGETRGAWAFVAWGFFRGHWYRIGWAAAPLLGTPWVPPDVTTGGDRLASFYGELAALESAGLWVSAMLDFWYLHTSARPEHVTIAVDNASALQIAAGHGKTTTTLARLTRQAWQSAQARVNTYFRHVHSHTGLLANSLADLLAGQAAKHHPSCRLSITPAMRLELSAEDIAHFAQLWLIPACSMCQGRPTFIVPEHARRPSTDPELERQQSIEATPTPAESPRLLEVQTITANVQTIKDAPISIFNPSGLAARRQYLYRQAQQCSADIVCLQETRSAAGRWKGPGLLTWRSGATKGQYGCEVWVKAEVVKPALGLQDWRILLATPRILAVTCVDTRFPVTIISAHAPHADRPDSEARCFWQELSALLRRAPTHRALVLGIDANGDFYAPDEDRALIGELVAVGEAARNDELLLELCLTHGLEAPSTFDDVQKGPGWTWQRTSGRRKRIDHVLFRPGPWQHKLTAQALDFDIINSARDHVAARARSLLRCPRPMPSAPRPKRATREEILSVGAALWAHIHRPAHIWRHPEDLLSQLSSHYHEVVRALPAQRPLQIRQPYLGIATVSSLEYLRDWRAQIRTLHREHSLMLLRAAWATWTGSTRSHHYALHQHRLVIGSFTLQERRLQLRVHQLARQDKIRHFEQLTNAAIQEWHCNGQPLQAIVKLRWASRRAADRRAVQAAGGYDIDDALEEQFRAQEGGRRVSPQQLRSHLASWAKQEASPCLAALPNLSDLEQCCLKQQDGKAPGPDSLPNELWKHFPEHAGQWLWKVCMHAALSGREPRQFKKALQCALYKRGPASLPSNYRSIALLNGVAKIWHSHIRSTVGAHILAAYDDFQLGGRKHIPVSFAVATYRTVWDLCVQQGRCAFAIFVDIQAAYYETSRQLLFQGDPNLSTPAEARLHHLARLTSELLHDGALTLLGITAPEVALLQDCVACSYWQMIGSGNLFLATRGSRPGDGLADILFGALFTVALRHIRRTCAAEGLVHASAAEFIGRPAEIIPVGWADDLAVLADFPDPLTLQQQAPRVADITISTLEHLRFRVNLGRGKTETMIDVRGPAAKKVRGDLLSGSSTLTLPDTRTLRISSEYRYLGVIQQPRDTGRRDQELALQRAQSAWAQARSLIGSASLPWALRHAWIAGRVLPAAYATLATSTAVSGRATAPLEGFFERATRALSASWQFGHVLSKPSLYLLACLPSPGVATIVARARLVTQLCHQAPAPVWEIFEAGWNRATTLCSLLADACQSILPAIPSLRDHAYVTLPLLQQHHREFRKACQHISRFGTTYRAFWDLWQDIALPRSKRVIGTPGQFPCPLCRQMLPSLHALAAHTHRKHSVVNSLTQFTAGTVCLWCHVEHYSTDRLKYHLRRSPSCVHGLRVTVGRTYTYGSGTKRRGAQHHRGLPPLQLPGPRNATPAQRLAALEGRLVTPEEMSNELRAATGVTDVYSWPDTPPVHAQVLGDRPAEPASPSLLASLYAAPPAPAAPSLRFWQIADACEPGTRFLPSPLWSGLAQQTVCWGLPRAWHRWWRLWLAADLAADPWGFSQRAALAPLRPRAQQSSTHHALFLRQLGANTVAFRQICLQVLERGLLWIPGVPSSAGQQLLRRVLPQAHFRTVQSSFGPLFLAAHSLVAATTALPVLLSACSSDFSSWCTVRALQPSIVYRTRPLTAF